MPDSPRKFFLTTPIYYVNARPHIGHAYTTIVADVLARRSRAQDNDTWFLTGTDEHGQKIERSAAAAGIAPQQFTDNVSAEFKQLWDRMGLTYDQYIRTTDPAHKRGVQHLWRELESRGHIYLSSYTGQYCVSEEIFVEGPPGTIGPDGRPTETVTEENYFFRLGAFQRPLIDLIESDTLEVRPEARKNELLSFLRGNPDAVLYPDKLIDYEEDPPRIERSKAAVGEGRLALSAEGKEYVPGALRDLSISRSSFTWGIPVPDNPKHVIYVWLDALANYMTAVGYGSDAPEDREKFQKYWPADLHLVGKEIIRQHCIYWPAFLLALNPELQHELGEPMPILAPGQHRAWAEKMLPKKVVAHGWLLFEESKMSKSRGNIVRTETILEAFGTLCPAPTSTDSVVEMSSGLQPAEPDTEIQRASAPATPNNRDLFAADVLRYFLLREIPFGQDGSFSFDAMITRYNADLANGYGNLVSRTLNALTRSFNQSVPTPKELESRIPEHAHNFFFGGFAGPARMARKRGLENSPLVTAIPVGPLTSAFQSWVSGTFFNTALENLWWAISGTDEFLTRNAPWKLVNGSAEEKALAADVLYTAAESIRIITALLYPILPYATAAVWRQLGLGDIEAAAQRGELTNLQWGGLEPGTRLGPLAPIFPRADVSPDKGLARIMADIEAQKTLAPASTQSEFPEAPLASATPASGDAPLAAESATYSLAAESATYSPAAGPRTATLAEPNPGAQVGGSSSPTAVLPTSAHHTDAQPSGIFAGTHPTTDNGQQTTPADASPQITIDDFAKVELRVAQILVAERIPKADKLLRLEVDLGYEKRQILSGIAEWYTPEDLIGRRIVVITNLAPRKMRGLESHGMLLAASAPQKEGEKPGKPALATFQDTDDLPLGARLK
jgi:methionyl-tRNA synthetase